MEMEFKPKRWNSTPHTTNLYILLGDWLIDFVSIKMQIKWVIHKESILVLA